MILFTLATLTQPLITTVLICGLVQSQAHRKHSHETRVKQVADLFDHKTTVKQITDPQLIFLKQNPKYKTVL